MHEPDLIRLFIPPLKAAGIEYMISGSVAAIFYGEPRATLDIDIAVLLPEQSLSSLRNAFHPDHYYVPPIEILEIERTRPARGHFNIVHHESGLRADFYPSREHPYFEWAMEHRKDVALADLEITLAPVEYVILWKMEFYREGAGEKHLTDVTGILRVQGDSVDRRFLEAAAMKLGLSEILNRASEGI